MRRELLKTWLSEQVFPTWATRGADPTNGGFYELLNSDLTAVERPRRARLVGRQIYCFSVAKEIGWKGDCKSLVDNGLSFLRKYLIRVDQTVRCSVSKDGEPANDSVDLYDDAFVLFALATVVSVFGRNSDIEELARGIADATISRARRVDGAFQEHENAILANPNMHLMEAFLAWCETASSQDNYWIDLTEQLANCALNHMIEENISSLPEYFDANWVPIRDENGLLIEPGHQFEWAWLLARWSFLNGNREMFSSAMIIANIGEKFGVDRSQKIVINSINEHHRPRDKSAKLWPQAERSKFWHAVSLHPFATLEEKIMGRAKCEEALEGMCLFFKDSPPGLWREVLSYDNGLVTEPTRASSLYHIVSAILTVNRPYVSAGFNL
ncbi:MAG: AGE family epimerase/isomerase [Rhodospirillales bacterium]